MASGSDTQTRVREKKRSQKREGAARTRSHSVVVPAHAAEPPCLPQVPPCSLVAGWSLRATTEHNHIPQRVPSTDHHLSRSLRYTPRATTWACSSSAVA